MHLGNAALTPECAALTWGAACLGLGACGWAVRRTPLDGRKLAAAGALSAAVFAAQAVNVPVLPHSSAHLVGGVLLCWAAGPALGALCLAVVLAVQAWLLGDGGIAAWGANVLHMALLPAGLVALATRRAETADRWSRARLAGGLAWLAVVGGAVLIPLDVALFRPLPEGWLGFAAEMAATHVWIGLLEGLLTVAALALLYGEVPAPARGTLSRRRWTGLAAAAVIAAIATPLASALPDGYESTAERHGLSSLLAGGNSLGTLSDLTARVSEAAPGAEIAVMLVAAALAGGAAWALAGMLARRASVS